MKRVTFFLLLLITIFFTDIHATKVFMFGDSTMANYDKSKTEQRGWGMFFGTFLKDGVECVNKAKPGYDSRNGYKVWKMSEDEVSPGDYVIIQFAHNDEKNNGIDCYQLSEYYTDLGMDDKASSISMRGTTPYGTYKEVLTQFVEEVKAKGATPILLSSICLSDFNSEGKTTRRARHDLGDQFSSITADGLVENQKIDNDDHTMDYVYHMKDVAEQNDVPFVNMTIPSGELLESFDQTFLKEKINMPGDHTHFKSYGAYLMARLAASLISDNGFLLDCIDTDAIDKEPETVIPIPYAVYEENTLTFYYDNQSSNRSGDVYNDIKCTSNSDKWGEHSLDITKVVIEPSFAYAWPTSTAFWFSNCKNLEEINGLNYLNTTNVTTMYAMFNAVGMSSKKITELDLTSFNTKNVTNMTAMFMNAIYMNTINVGYGWNTDRVYGSGNMFQGCKKLVGGDGTTYNPDLIDKTLAYVGEGGYLTNPNPIVIPDTIPYAVYNKRVLTFYYDNMYESRTGDVYTNIIRTKKTDGWGVHNDEIVKVVFNPSFADALPTTTAHWFDGCKALTTISGMNYLNTSEVTSMYAMFNGCIVLRAADLSDFNTAKVKNMSYMFNYCHMISYLNMKSFDTFNVTNMNYMFNSCQELKTIEVSILWTTNNVTKSTNMFSGCKKLMGSDATRYNANVTDMGAAHTDVGGYLTGSRRAYVVYEDGTLTFYYDDQTSRHSDNVYTYLIREKWTDLWGAHREETTKVVFDPSFADTHPGSLLHWFNSFAKLTTIEGIQYLNTSDVTTMSCMFSGCKAIATLDLTCFDTGKVTNMNQMFNSNSKLKTILVSDSWTTDNVKTSNLMFKGCKSIVGQFGTTFDANNVDKTLAYVGWGGYLTDPDVIVPDPLPYAVYENGTLSFYYDNEYECHTGDVYTDIVRKRKNDLWGVHNDDIVKVVFNASFAEARPTTTAQWFNGCKALTTISGLNYLNTSEVTTMYAMFNGCSLLKDVNVGKFNTAKVKNMSYMFNLCKVLTTLDLKGFDTSNVTNMNYMFYSCQNLKTIEVGDKWNTDKVAASNYMFTFCINIIGGDLTTYNENITDKTVAHAGSYGYLTDNRHAYVVYENGILTFYFDDNYSKRTGDVYTNLIRTKSGDLWGEHRTEVTKAVFDSSFADVYPSSISNWFNGCKIMTSIEGLEYLNTCEVTNMTSLFSGCMSLKIIDLGNFDTGKVTNMNYMFNSCLKLKTIYVTDSWTTENVKLSGNMFYCCNAIVGGSGTKFDSNYINKTMAHAGQGGYLTYKSNGIKNFNDTDFDTTAIDDIYTIEDLMSTTTADVYTLQGILIGKNIDLKPIPKGIYILNGKQVMIK